MSKKPRELQASEAIAKAKENAIARKNKTAKLLHVKALEAIDKMVEEGVVSCSVFLTEDEFLWGAPQVKTKLESLGYQVSMEESEERDSDIPDMEISIEHLK